LIRIGIGDKSKVEDNILKINEVKKRDRHRSDGRREEEGTAAACVRRRHCGGWRVVAANETPV